MLQRGNHIIQQSWIRSIQCFIAIVIFLLASTSYGREALPKYSASKAILKQSQPAKESKPSLPVPEIPEENEAEEEPGVDGDGEVTSYSGIVSDHDSSELLLQASIRSWQNRHTISLFILYHAWKSFLS